jgi:predicted  nucleic acid-binding Zn-ribbon protein
MDDDFEWQWFIRDHPEFAGEDPSEPDRENRVWPVMQQWREQRMAEVAQFGPEVMFERLHDQLQQEITSVALQLRAADEDLRQREASLHKQVENGNADLKAQADTLQAARAELRAEVDKVAAARQAFDSIDPELLVRMAPKQEGETELQFRLRTGKHS